MVPDSMKSGFGADVAADVAVSQLLQLSVMAVPSSVQLLVAFLEEISCLNFIRLMEDFLAFS